MHEVYESFLTLSVFRGFNETGYQPLAFAEIVAIMNERRIVDLDERYEFIRYVRALDQLFIKLSQDKLSRERDRLLKKSGSSKMKK